jgi:phospholipid/cholesterol/gamma-HCH transport system substrate-binding protein
MPERSKVTWAKLKVGLMALAALIIVSFLIFLMAGTQGLFQPKARLYTYLTDANALASGAPVTLAGVDIGGKVESVELNTGSNDSAKTVKVTLQLPSKYLSSIPVDSQTKMASANLLGTYYINIQRGKSPQSVQPGAVLPSTQTAEIADLFQQSSQTLGTLDSVVDKVNAIIADIQAGKGSIGQLLVDDTLVRNFVDIEVQFKQLASDLHNTITSSDNSLGKLLNDKGALYDGVNNGLDSLDKSLAGVNKIVDGVNSGQGTLGQLVQNPAMYDDFRQILSDVHTLLAGIQAGQGTAGKLLKTDEFGDQIKNTLGKVDGLLDKMNNGSGTVARLLNDPVLFDDLDATARETNALLKDFRANPKKFLRIKMSIF